MYVCIHVCINIYTYVVYTPDRVSMRDSRMIYTYALKKELKVICRYFPWRWVFSLFLVLIRALCLFALPHFNLRNVLFATRSSKLVTLVRTFDCTELVPACSSCKPFITLLDIDMYLNFSFICCNDSYCFLSRSSSMIRISWLV